MRAIPPKWMMFCLDQRTVRSTRDLEEGSLKLIGFFIYPGTNGASGAYCLSAARSVYLPDTQSESRTSIVFFFEMEAKYPIPSNDQILALSCSNVGVGPGGTTAMVAYVFLPFSLLRCQLTVLFQVACLLLTSGGMSY